MTVPVEQLLSECLSPYYIIIRWSRYSIRICPTLAVNLTRPFVRQSHFAGPELPTWLNECHCGEKRAAQRKMCGCVVQQRGIAKIFVQPQKLASPSAHTFHRLLPGRIGYIPHHFARRPCWLTQKTQKLSWLICCARHALSKSPTSYKRDTLRGPRSRRPPSLELVSGTTARDPPLLYSYMLTIVPTLLSPLDTSGNRSLHWFLVLVFRHTTPSHHQPRPQLLKGTCLFA